MFIIQLIAMAFSALRRNILRSALTMLGIIIGVGAVITMMEIGNGASQAIQKSISSMGANILMIRPAATTKSGISSGMGGQITLTNKDCQAIRTECTSVSGASPMLTRRGIQAIAGNQNWTPSSVYSGNEDYFTVRDYGEITLGRYFDAVDVRSSATVCMIGKTVADNLYGSTEAAVNATIRLNNINFKVLGVLPAKGANMMGMDQDDLVILPWTTMQARLSRGGTSAIASGGGTTSTSTSSFYPAGNDATYPARDSVQAKNYPMPIRFNNIDVIVVGVANPDDVAQTTDEVRTILRRQHKLEEGEEDDFDIRNMAEMLKTLSSTSTMMTTLLLIVAMISLVVGGVGIMNIMLVSVTERTREIGLRMAIGARGSRIMMQFLVESILLCLLGGIVGILLGRGISIAVATLLGWPIAISVTAIMISAGVSALIGIVFGFYPAWRASQLNPIDALRHE